jgi:site-specific recombinase XerD
MKEPNAYVFSTETNHFKKLRREVITTDVNKVMHKISKIFPGQPNITSHSFRVVYITQLWKDSKDIEFVKQTIGHQNLDTTSAYVNKLSDQERRERISQLDQTCLEKGLGFDLSTANRGSRGKVTR